MNNKDLKFIINRIHKSVQKMPLNRLHFHRKAYFTKYLSTASKKFFTDIKIEKDNIYENKIVSLHSWKSGHKTLYITSYEKFYYCSYCDMNECVNEKLSIIKVLIKSLKRFKTTNTETKSFVDFIVSDLQTYIRCFLKKQIAVYLSSLNIHEMLYLFVSTPCNLFFSHIHDIVHFCIHVCDVVYFIITTLIVGMHNDQTHTRNFKAITVF